MDFRIIWRIFSCSKWTTISISISRRCWNDSFLYDAKRRLKRHFYPIWNRDSNWEDYILLSFHISWSKKESLSADSSFMSSSSALSLGISVTHSSLRGRKLHQVLPQDHRQRRRRHSHQQGDEGVQRLPRIRWQKTYEGVQRIWQESWSQWTFRVPYSQDGY